MLSAILSTTILGQTIATPRLLETLPNGSRIWAESMPAAKDCTVILWLSSPEIRETPATHGQRHLLEHLIAKGPDSKLDIALENRGLMLLAETSRDAIHFRIDCPPDQLNFVIESILAVTKPRAFTAEEIQREAVTITDEYSGLSIHRRLVRAVWNQEMGAKSLDPFGDPATMKAITPESLTQLHLRLSSPKSLLFTITGPQKVTDLMAKARELLSEKRDQKVPVEKPNDPSGNPNPNMMVGVPGSGIGLISEGVHSSLTLANLAIGLSLSQSRPGFEVSFTPSVKRGLIVVTSSSQNVGEAIQSLSDRDLLLGKNLLLSYLRQTSASAGRLAAFRGALLAQRESVSPKEIEIKASNLTLTDLTNAKSEAKYAEVVVGLQ